jgi:phytoene dehydrogenase-like protein
MKKLILVGVALLMVTSLLLSACAGGVSQEDYDAVIAERDAAQAELAGVEEATSQHIVEYKIQEYDAVVIGAGYGGLISAAILAKNGLKTVIVDPADQIGGATGAVNHDGYWLDMSLRSWDTGDVVMVIGRPPNDYGRQAAEAAGAEIEMVPVGGMRGHVYPTGEIADIDMTSMESLANWFTKTVGVPEEKVMDFMMLLGNIMALDPVEYRDVLLGDWLKDNVEDEEMRTYLNRYLIQMFCRPPEESSVGRVTEFFNLGGETFRANDPEAGGMQAFMEPYARVVRDNGGEIMLRQTPVEILVESGKVRGVVVVDKAGNVQELRAPVVVFGWALWHVLDLLDESLLPQQLVESAREFEQSWNLDTVMVYMGLSGVPTVRETGQPDDFDGFQRVVVGSEREYGGGWILSSLASPTAAPEGKQLITFIWCTSGNIDPKDPPFKSFAQAKEKILSTAIACARDYYSDLDEITEWTSFNYYKGGGCIGWNFSPAERAPVRCPTIEGLYFVGSSTELPSQVQDRDAQSALIATEVILGGR